MLGDCMTCMGICLNGVGIGIIQVIIQVVLRMTRLGRTPGLTVCYAAGVGTFRRRVPVLPFGPTNSRTTGTATSASGWCVPEFCQQQRRNAKAVGGVACLTPVLRTVTLSLRTTTLRLCVFAPLREVFAKNLSEKIHAEAQSSQRTRRILFKPSSSL